MVGGPLKGISKEMGFRKWAIMNSYSSLSSFESYCISFSINIFIGIVHNVTRFITPSDPVSKPIPG